MKFLLLALFLTGCEKHYLVHAERFDKMMFICSEGGASGYPMMMTENVAEANAFCEKQREKK